MSRTATRPVAAGRISPAAALAFGLTLAALSFLELSLTVNLPYDRSEEILGLSMGARASRVVDRAAIAPTTIAMTRKSPAASGK